jgi:hypothetical protein
MNKFGAAKLTNKMPALRADSPRDESLSESKKSFDKPAADNSSATLKMS